MDDLVVSDHDLGCTCGAAGGRSSRPAGGRVVFLVSSHVLSARTALVAWKQLPERKGSSNIYSLTPAPFVEDRPERIVRRTASIARAIKYLAM